MNASTLMEGSRVTAGALRPLLGHPATVRTTSSLLQGTLLSCVKSSLWLVVDATDTDVVVPLDDVAWVETAGRHLA